MHQLSMLPIMGKGLGGMFGCPHLNSSVRVVQPPVHPRSLLVLTPSACISQCLHEQCTGTLVLVHWVGMTTQWQLKALLFALCVHVSVCAYNSTDYSVYPNHQYKTEYKLFILVCNNYFRLLEFYHFSINKISSCLYLASFILGVPYMQL